MSSFPGRDNFDSVDVELVVHNGDILGVLGNHGPWLDSHEDTVADLQALGL